VQLVHLILLHRLPVLPAFSSPCWKEQYAPDISMCQTLQDSAVFDGIRTVLCAHHHIPDCLEEAMEVCTRMKLIVQQ
jgi:hypothetical protein